MGIINRDLSSGLQRNLFGELVTITTGVTYPIANVPWAGMLEQISIAASGISGTPFVIPEIHRFIVGTGFTVISGGSSVGSTTTVADYGTSGITGVSLIAGGISLLAGDSVVLRSGGANSSINNALVNTVVRCLQDIKSFYGATYLP